MAEAYINERRLARQLAQDFLAANPGQHSATVSKGGIRLALDAAGNEVSSRTCEGCRNDMSVNYSPIESGRADSCFMSTIGSDSKAQFPPEPCYRAKESA